jgi:hypothetical protein
VASYQAPSASLLITSISTKSLVAYCACICRGQSIRSHSVTLSCPASEYRQPQCRVRRAPGTCVSRDCVQNPITFIALVYFLSGLCYTNRKLRYIEENYCDGAADRSLVNCFVCTDIYDTLGVLPILLQQSAPCPPSSKAVSTILICWLRCYLDQDWTTCNTRVCFARFSSHGTLPYYSSWPE